MGGRKLARCLRRRMKGSTLTRPRCAIVKWVTKRFTWDDRIFAVGKSLLSIVGRLGPAQNINSNLISHVPRLGWR